MAYLRESDYVSEDYLQIHEMMLTDNSSTLKTNFDHIDNTLRYLEDKEWDKQRTEQKSQMEKQLSQVDKKKGLMGNDEFCYMMSTGVSGTQCKAINMLLQQRFGEDGKMMSSHMLKKN